MEESIENREVVKEPWYKFVDPFVVLKGYKIMDYMRATHEKE